MKLRRAIAAPARAAAFAVLAMISGASCSSSTDAAPRNITADGFKITVNTTPDSVLVGDYLTVTMIVENTTSETILRAFPPNNFGPEPSFDLSYFEASFFSAGGFFGNLAWNSARAIL